MTQVITSQGAIDAVLKAVYANKLGFFITQSNRIGCQYLYDTGHRCAVGAMLNDETMQQVQAEGLNRNSVHALLNEKIITCDSEDTKGLICCLQVGHDNLLKNSIPDVEERKTHFLNQLRSLCDTHNLEFRTPDFFTEIEV